MSNLGIKRGLDSSASTEVRHLSRWWGEERLHLRRGSVASWWGPTLWNDGDPIPVDWTFFFVIFFHICAWLTWWYSIWSHGIFAWFRYDISIYKPYSAQARRGSSPGGKWKNDMQGSSAATSCSWNHTGFVDFPPDFPIYHLVMTNIAMERSTIFNR